MLKNSHEVLKYIKDENIRFVDVRFIDLPGVMQHFNMPVESFDQAVFDDGLMFDGSSIRGFQAIHESDMKLIPDPTTAFIDPFRSAKTLVMNFSIRDPFTDEQYSRDPRNVAAKAEAYLASTGIADTVYFGAEAEFYVFDDVRFETNQHESYYHIDSIEAPGTPAAPRRAATAATRPATRAATSLSRRSITSPTSATTWSPSFSRWACTSSARTMRLAPQARVRSTTGSTPSPQPLTS